MLVEIAQALGPVEQDYLVEARQMQALSFAMHIPLVCFGVAFPALVLGMEWLGRRRGDALLVALARRWSKAMVALFAIGVVTGTILSFELGLLWPEFMATYGDVFGLAFALEGFSFFVEAIFIAIYVYGWDRLSPRAHMLAGIPVVIAGFSGSLMVITVNGWMNHPSGFRMENGRAVDVEPFKALFANSYFWHELVHMYLAAFLVAGFVTASVYAVARLRGRRDRYVRVAMAVPLVVAAITAPAQVVVGDWAAREVAENQPTKLAAFEGLGHTRGGRADPHRRLVRRGSGEVRYGIAIPKLLSLLAFHDPNATVRGPRPRPAGRPAARQRRAARVRDDGRDRHADGALRRGAAGRLVAAPRAARRALVPADGRRARPAVGGGAARRLGDDRGRPPAVGRLRPHADGGRRDRRRRHPARLRGAGRSSTRRSSWRRCGCCGGWRARRSCWRRAMGLAELPLLLALVGLAAYVVLGGADFGAGLWYMLLPGERRRPLRDHTYHAMGPVWEANHVWLIFVLVVVWTAYPLAFGAIFSTLYVPLFAAALGIILRGACYAVRSAVSAPREERILGALFGASSVLTPFALGAAIGGIASGRVPLGNAAGDAIDSWLNPTSIAVGVLAVATSAYLAAVWLTADAAPSGSRSASCCCCSQSPPRRLRRAAGSSRDVDDERG